MKRIENDEQYQKSLDWLVERSKMLANPLVDLAEKARVRALYDAVEREVIRYRMPHILETTNSALDALLD
jgi:hypothetical protein